MSHYDSCRPGYCGSCGAGPGNLQANGGICPFCYPKGRTRATHRRHEPKEVRHMTLIQLTLNTGEPVFVNPQLIVSIVPYGTGSALQPAAADVFIVKEKPDAVRRRIHATYDDGSEETGL